MAHLLSRRARAGGLKRSMFKAVWATCAAASILAYRILFCIKSEYNLELIAKIMCAYKNYYPAESLPAKGQKNDAFPPPAPGQPARMGTPAIEIAESPKGPVLSSPRRWGSRHFRGFLTVAGSMAMVPEPFDDAIQKPGRDRFGTPAPIFKLRS